MKRTKKTFLRTAAAMAAALAVAACGSSDSSPQGAGGGTGGTPVATSQGAITSTGPLTVNGVRFDASAASITIDGVSGRSESELRSGMVVKVKGTKDDASGSGRATEVEAHRALAGKVDDKGSGTLRVGGHEVEIEQETHFDDDATRLASIAVGDRVRVHGHPTSLGRIRATRVEKEPGTSEAFDVKGVVLDLDRAAGRFTLKVTPDAASSYAVTLASGVSIPAGVVNGSWVEVRSATAPVAGALVASAVVLEDGSLGAAQAEAEVEGLVTSGTSASFVVDGHSVTTTASTRWDNGVPADLAPGVKVEAEGRLDAAGVLVATKVSFRANVLLQGPVASVAATSAREGTFQVLGITVRTDALTEWRASGGGALDLTNVGAGPVEVRGTLTASGEIAATRVTATNDDRLYLQGTATAKDATYGTLTVLGITVQAAPGAEFSGAAGTATTSAAFFAEVVAGRTVVKARSRVAFAGGTLTADKLEVEGSR
ncbi:MAG TPA: DUF5666 domain-containing protein [Anaeromyxobacteraceae bacterium]|nr:DUF5666 domain-containing protein [Anaeromyxobacteraceae bacterium]